MSATVSPLAPKSFADPEPVEGVRLAVAQAGIKYKGRTDLLVALFDPGTTVAGVFTTSKCPSAPVEWCREALKGESARALAATGAHVILAARNGVRALRGGGP